MLGTDDSTGSVGLTATDAGFVYQYGPGGTYSNLGYAQELLLSATGQIVASPTTGLKMVHPSAAAAHGSLMVGGSIIVPAIHAFALDPFASSANPILLNGAAVNGISIVPAIGGGFLTASTGSTVKNGTETGSLELALVSETGSPRTQHTFDTGASLPRRPSLVASASGYALLRVENRPASADGSRIAELRLSLLNGSLAETQPSVLIDSWTIPDGSVHPTTRSEDIRPQITATPNGFVIGWFDPLNHFQVRRLTASGDPICGPVRIGDVSAWGFTSSLVSDSSNVLMAVTDSKGMARLIQMDRHCLISGESLPINTPGSTIALGAQVPGMFARVGQPAIARASNGNLAIGWVETDATPASETVFYRLEVRMTTSLLCE